MDLYPEMPLKEAIDKQVLKISDKPTIDEMFSFIVAQTSSSWKAQAEQGGYDDLVMSLAIAWQMYQNVQAPIEIPPDFNQDKKDWTFK